MITTETHLLITVGLAWAVVSWGPMPGFAINIDLLRDRMNSTPRYAEALNWAEELHRNQHRRGKKVPFLSHVISVSALVWEDGGNEDQAIAGLLHDAIEDAGQSHASIEKRFGETVADIVSDCTDPGKIPSGQDPEPWPVRKQRFIACLDSKPRASLLVTAADKAHNSRDHLLDAGVDPERWNKFLPRFDGLAWYFWSLSHKLQALLPGSRSVKILGQTVSALLTNPVLIDRLPPWQDPEDWLAGYLDRPDTHPLP